jgi:hypothetical protein
MLGGKDHSACALLAGPRGLSGLPTVLTDVRQLRLGQLALHGRIVAHACAAMKRQRPLRLEVTAHEARSRQHRPPARGEPSKPPHSPTRAVRCRMRPLLLYGLSVAAAAWCVSLAAHGALPAAGLAGGLAGMAAIAPTARRDLAAAAARDAPRRAHLERWGWSESSGGLWRRAGRLKCEGVRLPAASARSLTEAYARQQADERLVQSAVRARHHERRECRWSAS